MKTLSTVTSQSHANIFFTLGKEWGMPRKKTAEVEILPLEDDQQTRGRKKLVEAEHTIKYSAPVPVTVETDPEEDSQEEDFDFVEEKVKRRRKTTKDERDDLRRELDKLGVASVSRLKLSIDKYRHSDSDDSGTLAEKDYCVKYPVTKDHIIQEEYMDVARRYGPGRYWFTLRMDNKIVRQWERQVSAPVGPAIQHVNPNDPTSPQVIVQMPEGQQPMPIADPFKEAERALNLVKKYNEAFGGIPQGAQSRSEEEVLTTAILKQPEVIENVVGSVIKRFGGKGGGDDEPGWSTVVMEAVKNNQVAASIQAFGNIALMFLDRILPQRGNNNGTPQMAQAPLQNQTQAGQYQPGNLVSGQEVEQMAAASGTVGNVAGALPANSNPQNPLSEDPYTTMLTSVIASLASNGPVEDAVKRVDGFLLLYPAYTETIDAQFSQPAETLLGAISTLPGCEQIAQAEHSKQWIENFQAKFFAESQEGEE
jgi:hypothetical protein